MTLIAVWKTVLAVKNEQQGQATLHMQYYNSMVNMHSVPLHAFEYSLNIKYPCDVTPCNYLNLLCSFNLHDHECDLDDFVSSWHSSGTSIYTVASLHDQS